MAEMRVWGFVYGPRYSQQRIGPRWFAVKGAAEQFYKEPGDLIEGMVTYELARNPRLTLARRIREDLKRGEGT